MEKHSLLEAVKGGIIVSCQALPDEPLFGSEMMVRMALAAEAGGAVGIRANTPVDIAAIKSRVKLPLVGLWKRDYEGSDVYITPTLEEVEAVWRAGADIIALDATMRPRPKGETLKEIVSGIKKRADVLLMADISTVEEGLYAQEAGFDILSTTMSGYTPYSPQQEGPDFKLIREMAARADIPVFAEGRIHTREDATECFRSGAHTVVIGGAITRPQQITKRFVDFVRIHV
ncbi:N-acetylmannosamine-6-phosphate 2-epimerase [Paenibacillus sp. UNC499MF]|uniref:N-acetylmannosamine-6-phosphate 2-epimerase n=1 Tax=Paenibacillus sp. UNC499MF TaxID=1502751 RepID=UPI0008A08E7A|nr:N-acetylmannosamine-6-phosphate 2-epimerase [Paenibacillus sp. UNC499MF]SEG51103.1 N-acylglucosamine-6-phosphate 2-epimerase [Paenibacillus sp. UNC499MF]